MDITLYKIEYHFVWSDQLFHSEDLSKGISVLFSVIYAFQFIVFSIFSQLF